RSWVFRSRCCSQWDSSVGGATGRKYGIQQCAGFGTAVAAVLEQEQHEFMNRRHTGAVEDGTAPALPRDKTGSHQHSQMRRHGVLRDAALPRQVAGGDALRLNRDERAENIQPGRLGERRKHFYCHWCIHISRIMDACDSRMTGTAAAYQRT